MRVRYDMVQCYVVRRKGGEWEYLQLRRAMGDFMGGTWQNIYGGIREGERAWETALRELKEETGLVPLEFYQFDTLNTFYLAADDSIWNVPGFCAVVATDAEVVLNEEHDACRWINREKIMENLMWPGERAVCQELFREIFDDGPAKPFLKIKLDQPL